MNAVWTYIQRRLGEPTTITGLAIVISSTVAFVMRMIDLTTYGTALAGGLTMILSPQKAQPIQGASEATSKPTAPVEVVATTINKGE